MWTYSQGTGELFNAEGDRVGVGYSGAPGARNNSFMQYVHNTGPIPQGRYEIGDPVDTVTHGPFVLPLTPYPGNVMFGRSGFLIHGDSVINPGSASMGCIIMDREVREAIWISKDLILEVVEKV